MISLQTVATGDRAVLKRPRREATGDVFYLHGRLLERRRASRRSTARSLTALTIIETRQVMSRVHPQNVIRLRTPDYLERFVLQACGGHSVGISVSRVGQQRRSSHETGSRRSRGLSSFVNWRPLRNSARNGSEDTGAD